MGINEKILTLCKNTKFCEPMKKHTTFKIGGECDIMCEPQSVDEIRAVMDFAKSEDIPYFVMGNGSNLLVGDKGIRGIVIKISDAFSDVHIDGNVIYAECGVLLTRLAKMAQKEGLSGMENISGIPGTLGGAIYMNAGAYGSEIADIIKEVTYLEDGEVKTVQKDGLGFGYRKSIFTNTDAVILSCVIELKKGNQEEIDEKVKEVTKKRCEKQPLNYPSAGSTFKRPEGYFAGKLIEDCGLKGASVGGAMVSKKHAGFIINTGDATASDVLSLIEKIQQTVYENFGVEIEPEIKLTGEK